MSTEHFITVAQHKGQHALKKPFSLHIPMGLAEPFGSTSQTSGQTEVIIYQKQQTGHMLYSNIVHKNSIKGQYSIVQYLGG